MFGAAWAVALSLSITQPPGLPRPRDRAEGPRLVIKEKDYFLHALPPPVGPQPAWGFRTPRGLGRLEAVPDGLVLLHTSTATGEMKVLAAGGTSLVDMQRNSGPARFTSRIVGVAADRERLYVLHWQGGERQPSCSLLVFRPDSGVLIHSLELTGDDVPKEEPKETTDRGPLRLRPDGVACFGARFEFKGTELLKPPGEKNP